jgi:hypothetical protein
MITYRFTSKNLGLLGLALVFGLAFSGCGKTKDSAAETAGLFDKASPEVKAMWDRAVTADKTNDYAMAYLTLRKLRSIGNLNPQQLAVLDQLSGSVNQRMFKAADQGDANAKQAIRDVNRAFTMPP